MAKKRATSRRKGAGGARGSSTTTAGKKPKAGRAAPRAPDVRAQSDRPDIRIVGIGASAGGLRALREFFENVGEDSGLAYVVVVHLSPEHESHLAGLLQPHTNMDVLQVTETVPLKRDCVYVIPPNANLSAIDTHLRLSALEERRGERAPIDHFFRTLAENHDGHAIGVIMTGTGSDGTLGVKEIKLRGGLTVVQDPNEAEYDGMPQSAIATGFVDLVLPVASIPSAVLRFARTEPRLPLAHDGEAMDVDHRVLLQKIFAQVRARTGRDFTRYKRSTIMRRIQRRMQLRYVEELDRYVELMRHTPEEVRALSDDLLITVTSFFRDPEVFDKLAAEVIPALFEGRGPDDEIRAWCVGCATGEEVYSVAMLLLEEAGKREGLAPKLHIFASDLHERSLEMAREGFYPGDISAEVSQERLKRFFVEETGGYRVRKEVRELVVFAPHNLLGDPPFSRLDMVICRNLMIYLQRDVQGDVLRIFHYALKPGSFLVLGTSETVDDAELFRTVDKKLSIHRRGHAHLPEPRLPVFPISRPEHAGSNESVGHVLAPQQYEAMHLGLISEHARPSLLVGPDGQVVHLSDSAGRYLEHPAGRLTASATKLVRRELAVELISALHAARKDRRPAQSKPVQVGFNGDARAVVLRVYPATETQSDGYCLVTFDEIDTLLNLPPGAGSDGSDNRRIQGLAHELESTRQRLQTIIEEFETTQEEMKASNEELQSANEELRSTMEELETSKEELQSMNEELQTVNQENRHKVEELALLSSDLQNLLTATDIATLFLDRELRILRFTPKVTELINVRTMDRGRPVFELTHRLGYPDLKSDAETVLRRLTQIEREVKDELGRWFLTNLLPYRGRDDRIEGLVITFVDITRRKRSEEELQQLSRTLEHRVAERTRQVRHLTTSLVRAEQRERRRLSETLHDELQQLLFGVQARLRMAVEAAGQGGAEALARQLDGAEALLADGVRITRRLSVDLNPPILKNEGIRAIVEWLKGHMRELHGLDVQMTAPQEIQIQDGDARVMLFQVLRELLFNVAKHSGVNSARVAVRVHDGQLQVRVSDDGKGFDPGRLGDGAGTASLGLTNVRERLTILGGRMEIESKDGEGTCITIELPVAARIGES